MASQLDSTQILPHAFDDTSGGLKVTPSGGVLVSEDFDFISASYPAVDTELYTYKLGGSGGTTVATVTVVYSDATKTVLLSVTKV